MIRSRNARTVANLAIASALTIFLGACSSTSLPSLSSNPAPRARRGARNAGVHSRRRDRRPLGPGLVPESQRPRPHRGRGEGAMQAALRDRRRPVRRRGHASGRPGDAAGTAPEGQPGRQELYRSRGSRPAASRTARSCRSTAASSSPASSTRMPAFVTATWSTSAARRGLEVGDTASVIARSVSDEAIHASASGEMDCFASLAMTK